MRTLPAVCIAGLIVVFGGCSNPRPDAGGLEQQLLEAGLSHREATCVVDGVHEQFKDRRLDTRDTPSQLERARMNGVLADCDVETRYPELVPPSTTTTRAPSTPSS